MNRLQSRDVPWREPVMVATQLAALYGEEGLIWLDGDGSALGRWVTLGVAPVETVCCRGCPGEPGASNPFEALRQLDDGHWTGWLSYEAAAWSEPSNVWRADAMPSLWIARHDPILRFDLQNQQLWIEGTNPSAMTAMVEALATAPSPNKFSCWSSLRIIWRRWRFFNDAFFNLYGYTSCLRCSK